jgi:transposase-like protein
MAFVPPCCPHPECPSHRRGDPPSCYRKGRYRRRCDGRLVQRFLCHHCRRRFSTQSFRADHGLRKPWLCTQVVALLCSKVSIRRAAEQLSVRRPTVERRLDRYGAHGRQLHVALLERHRARGGSALDAVVLDELETFSNDRTASPVTVPVMVQPTSYFVVHVDVAPLPARGGLSEENEAKKRARQGREGVRRSGSDEAVRRGMQVWKRHVPAAGEPTLISDEKPSYARLFAAVFEGRGRHQRISSKRRRNTANPLFAVNMTNAMLRDGLGRLVRRSWGHSRDEDRLRRHLWLWVLFRNYVRDLSRRCRTTTSALQLGIVDRRFSLAEMLRWQAPFVQLMFNS